MSFDAFAALAQPRATVTADNVRLIDATQADVWLDRAHDTNAIDIDELKSRDQEALKKQFQRAHVGILQDEFESYGSKVDDLLAAAQALVDMQADAKRD